MTIASLEMCHISRNSFPIVRRREKMGILSSFGQDKRKIKKNPPINIKAIASTGWTPHTCWENMFQLDLNLMRFSVVCVFVVEEE
jgi:hypothetical protein